jgi:two-component system phosphate regulon sensor histidine kinase PhoR
MKKNKTYIFIILLSVSLAALLLIQINWIFKTAKIKEELFAEKATMVISRTVQELCADKETCTNMGNCCLADDGQQGCALKLDKDQINKIDSLLKHFMNFYNFHLDYSFEVIRPEPWRAQHENGNWGDNVFKKKLEEAVNESGLELKLIFPEKKKFILEEMGLLFISSILLIIVVFIMFIQTIRYLIKEKNISKHTTDFLNNMTHEFKTPLTNIGLAGKMILKDAVALHPEKIKHYSEIILSENEKLKLQVEQVLNMSALERGEIPLSLSKIDFHTIITDALKCMTVQIENKQGSLQVELFAQKHFVLGDKTHLTNTISNLIDNAIKYAIEKPAIKIETSNFTDGIILTITDNGIGIDKDHQKKVFQKFFRVPTGNVHDVKGFGLGLAYVQKIIELHHGAITLNSELNQGTTFTITLPTVNE